MTTFRRKITGLMSDHRSLLKRINRFGEIRVLQRRAHHAQQVHRVRGVHCGRSGGVERFTKVASNTSAASVGIALDEAVREGRIARGDLVLLVVFGAGLTWGAAVIEW